MAKTEQSEDKNITEDIEGKNIPGDVENKIITEDVKDKNVTKDVEDAPSRMSSAIRLNSMDMGRNSYIGRKSRIMSIVNAPITSDLHFVSTVDHFENLIDRLSEDENMKPVSTEISALLRRFRDTFSSQQRLVLKVRELNAEQEIYTKENEDYANILKKKEELIEILNKDLNIAREAQAEAIQLKNDAVGEFERCKIELLEEQLKSQESESAPKDDSGSGSSQRKQIMKLRQEIILERENFEKTLSDLTKELEDKDLHISDSDKKLTETNNILTETHDELLDVKHELQVESRKRGKADQQLVEAKIDIGEKQHVINDLQVEMRSIKTEKENLEIKIKTLMNENSELSKYTETLNQSLEKLKNTLSIREENLAKITRERNKCSEKLENVETEMKNAKRQIAAAQKKGKLCEKQILALEHAKTRSDQQIEMFQIEKVSFERNIEGLERELKNQELSNNEFANEVNMINDKLTISQQKIDDLTRENMHKDESKKILLNEMSVIHANLEKERSLNAELSLDRNRKIQAIERTMKQVNELKDKLTLQETNLQKSEKQLTKTEREFKIEKKLHSNTKENFRNCKVLLDNSQEEVRKFKNKLSVVDSYAIQLKEQILSQENQLSLVAKEKCKLENEISSLKEMLEKEKCAHQKAEVDKSHGEKKAHALTKEVFSLDKKLKCAKVEFDNMSKEKCKLQSLLVNKIGEMNLLLQKGKIMDLTLTRGKEEYSRRINDIKLLKTELLEKSHRQAVLDRKLFVFGQLKRELSLMQQELLKEKLRVKAIEGENPSNMHRWRILEGDDPERYQLIVKNQFLQKKLIKHTSELAQKEAELSEFKKQIETLKEELKKRQPAAEVVEELMMYKSKYLQTKKQCDSLSSQVNMFFSQYSSCKQENLKQKEELSEMKKKEYLKKLSNRLGCLKP